MLNGFKIEDDSFDLFIALDSDEELMSMKSFEDDEDDDDEIAVCTAIVFDLGPNFNRCGLTFLSLYS